MTTNQTAIKEQLKKRLFDNISAQIDLIGHVPDDIAKLVGNFKFDTALDQATINEDLVQHPDQAKPMPATGKDKALLADHLNNHYDQAFYSQDGITVMLSGGSEFRNIGYWDDSTTTLDQACEKLQDKLLEFIPEKTGTVLDVACGMGASTRRLLQYYPPENVWAINISEKQIESTRKNAPGCHASVMNAVDMTFENDSFDNIMCIEAAFHFQTRRKFLEDAHRILKRGGRLVLSDVLISSAETLRQYSTFPGPENFLASAEEYRALLADIGYRDIVIQDVSNKVWGAHFQHMVKRVHEEFYDGKLDVIQLTRILWTYYHLNAITGLCLFVSAQK